LERKFLGAVEPRADEQLLIASGQAPLDLVEYSQRVERELAAAGAAASQGT